MYRNIHDVWIIEKIMLLHRMITFVTCIKIMAGYEDFGNRLQTYIDCIHKGCAIPYEIIVVEDQTEKNKKFMRDLFTPDYLLEKHVRCIEYVATYSNPHGYNLIEAYSKNIGIREAKYNFICVTNCDIWMNDAFFTCLETLKQGFLYRFIQVEVGETEKILNENLLDPSKWTLNAIAYKSGDIMLTTKDIWLQIKGFPENDVWVHSDLIVCKVLSNIGIPLQVPREPRIYTLSQERTYQEKPFEFAKTLEYTHCCN